MGEGGLTRHGIEEYVSDCVILLDHRIAEDVATRRLRIVKYRGSMHGTNEYPFLIGRSGISVLPLTSLGLDYDVSTERVPTGVPRLDAMLGGKGFYRGSSILVSGTAGTGKSSLAASFARSACKRGERCLYVSFEETHSQIIRNMRSIGINLGPWVAKGTLQFHTTRPTAYGLEMHLTELHRLIDDFKPHAFVLDPVSNLMSVGSQEGVKSMLARVIDYLKGQGITAMFTDLTHGGSSLEATESAISSLMDTWILLRDIESGGERNRGTYILKSRGMAHSNQIREFVLTDKGIDLLDVYIGPGTVLTGPARVSQVAKEKAERLQRQQKIDLMQRQLKRKRAAFEAQVASLRADFETKEDELRRAITEAQVTEHVLETDRDRMGRMRGADKSPSAKK